MKIGIDLVGGDRPELLIDAINDYIKENNEEIYLYANKEDDALKNLKENERLNIVYCSEKVEKTDDPAMVFRTKKESTLVKGSKDLKEKKIDAFISAGNTGALVATGIFVVKRIKGISKPALPGFLPKQNSKTPIMLLDLGANIAATKENLLEYANISNSYMKNYYGIKNPQIKLLNIGEEETKGTDLYKSVFKELRDNKNINFTGNIEARDILKTDCDIVLMDGWTGNVVLKSIEGAVEQISLNFKGIFLKNLKNKLAALVLKKDIKNMADELDYREFGGTPILGVDGLLIKAHGSSNKRAYYQAIVQAKNLIDENFLSTLKKED